MTEQTQILQRRLECISRELKVLWIALKVFVFRIKPSLGARVMSASYVDARESVELTVRYCVELIGLDPGSRKKNVTPESPSPQKFTPPRPPFKICRKREKTDDDFMFENASGEIDKSEKHFNPPPPPKKSKLSPESFS